MIFNGNLARLENEPKTNLGRRLRAVRTEIGETDRGAMAQRLGVSKGALAYYERGERVPDADVLLAYREKLGVDVHWLLTGLGSMFDHASSFKTVVVPLDAELLEQLAKVAEVVHKEAGIKLPPSKLTVEAVELFNQLKAEVADLTDKEQIEANLPRLKLSLKRRLEQAKAKPGTGKRVDYST